MTYTCELFMDYAYEGDMKVPLHIRIQNVITQLIEKIQKFILKIRGIKKERIVPNKALNGYRQLAKMSFNCLNQCKSALQSNQPVKVIFNEPFDDPSYKALFSDEVKNKTSPGDYSKIASNEVLGYMNSAISALSAAKQGLRVAKENEEANTRQTFTQMISYAKFLLKISNRVLSFKDSPYVVKKHLPTTEIVPDEKKEDAKVNEAYLSCIHECDVAMELFGFFKKKEPKEATLTPGKTYRKEDTSPEANKYKEEIIKKTIAYLRKYIKDHNFDQKYKKSLFSYQVAKTICPDPNDLGVQLSENQNAIAYDYDDIWPESKSRKIRTQCKNTYGTDDIDKLEKSHPELFDVSWYDELVKVGIPYVNKFANDKYDVVGSNGDGDEGILYIDIYNKSGN